MFITWAVSQYWSDIRKKLFLLPLGLVVVLNADHFWWTLLVLVCPLSNVHGVEFDGAGVFWWKSSGWCLPDIPPIPLLIANFNCTVCAPTIRSYKFRSSVVWIHFWIYTSLVLVTFLLLYLIGVLQLHHHVLKKNVCSDKEPRPL